MKNSLTFLLLILLPSCNSESDSNDGGTIELDIDHSLRQFLEVRSLTGVIKVPKDQAAFLVTTLEFENGELMRTGEPIHNPTEYLPNGLVTAEFLWGQREGESRTTFVGGGQTSWGANEFWGKLNGGRSQGGHQQYEGYTVLGMAWSQSRRDGHAVTGGGFGLTRKINEQKFVGALVVKFFDSVEALVSHVEEYRQNKTALSDRSPGSSFQHQP